MKMGVHIGTMTCIPLSHNAIAGAWSSCMHKGQKWCMTVLHVCGAAVFATSVLALMPASIQRFVPAQLLALVQASSQAPGPSIGAGNSTWSLCWCRRYYGHLAPA